MIDLFKDVSEFCSFEIADAHKVPIAIIGAGELSMELTFRHTRLPELR